MLPDLHAQEQRKGPNPKRASEMNQNRPLRGQEEGRVSIPSESMVQGLKFPSQNPNPRGEEGGIEEEEQNAREGRRSPVLAPGERKKQRGRKGEEVRGHLTPTILNPKILNYS